MGASQLPQGQGGGFVAAVSLLGITSYRDVADITLTTPSSASFSDFDAVNLAVTFTTPPSGNVLVRLTGTADAGTGSDNVYWALRESTTEIGSQLIHGLVSSPRALSAGVYITGLTPGTSHTYKWAGRAAAGGAETSRLYTGPTFGPLVMEVWDAALTPAATGSTALVGAKAFRSAVYSVPNAVPTVIPWDAEEFDTHGFHDNVTNPSRFTVPAGQAGYYHAGVMWGTTVDLGADKRVVAYLLKNGVETRAARQEHQTGAAASGFAAIAITTLVSLAVGDYVEGRTFQDSGAGRDLDRTTSGMWVYKVGT